MQWRNNSRKNEEMEPKQKQYPAVDVTGPHGSFSHFLTHSFIPQHVLRASYELGMVLDTGDRNIDSLPEEGRDKNKACMCSGQG